MNRICLITGATSGLGKATAAALAKLGYNLILVARSEDKGLKLANGLTKKYGINTSYYYCDISSISSIKNLSKEIKESYDRIDVLINNAGVRFDEYKKSADGIELTFATNHLGHFLLTYLLLDLLKNSNSARIINVSSSAHSIKEMQINELINPKEYNRSLVYGRSKLANVLFSFELFRRLVNTNITVNTLDPGGVATNFARNNGLIPWIKHIGFYFSKHSLRTPKQGAETIIYLASSPEVEKVSGKFFIEKKQKQASPLAYNAYLAKQLWELSEKQCGIKFL